MIELKKIVFGMLIFCQLMLCSVNAQGIEFIDETLFCLPENSQLIF